MLAASQLALVGLFSVILIFNSQLVFADRSLNYEKIVDIEKDALETVFEDLQILTTWSQLEAKSRILQQKELMNILTNLRRNILVLINIRTVHQMKKG